MRRNFESYEFEVGPLDFKVMVHIGSDIGEMYEAVKKDNPKVIYEPDDEPAIDDELSPTLALTLNLGKTSHVMFKKNPPVGYVVHEAFHVLYYQFRRIGATFNDEELVAYNLDYLTQNIWDITRGKY